MYKVLFAEDELLVRLGLQNSIPWSKYQMELSALAENGIEAFRLFESIRPDVLITDLRMEGMDGVELVKRVRQIDKDCAIVVVSCMNDFETLRKLIPYNINAYVLKASISIDEVCDALQNVQEYLIRIGRKTDKAESSNDTLETHISKFLLGKIANCTWEKTDFMEYMLLFSLKDEDQTKINALAMEFIYELVRRQLPNKLLIPLKEKEFIIFYEHEERNIDERIKRINSSIEDFLGVRFVITYCNRKESESLKDWFDRAYVQQFNIDYDDNSGKALIQKSISYMSVLRTVVGTGLSVFCCSFLAYLFTKDKMPARKILYRFVVFTMYISGGMIATYIVMKSYGLLNNFWVYILPTMISAYNMILIKTYIEQLPPALEESAALDGAGYITCFFKIILPLCKPIIATVVVFVAVGQWNSWFDNHIYTRANESLTTLQYLLYNYLNEAQRLAEQLKTASSGADMTQAMAAISPKGIRMTITVLASLPIFALYPFMQKYFSKGIMVGAVKG